MGLSSQPEEALARRMAALDAEPQPDPEWPNELGDGGENVLLIGHFVAVMSGWTEAVVEREVGPGATTTPAAADVLMRDSRLLADIAKRKSSIVAGPIDRAKQQWTPIHRAALTGEPPSRNSFVLPREPQVSTVRWVTPVRWWRDE
jgi:hypothetical protein